MTSLIRRKASSAVQSKVHGGEYRERLRTFDVETQLFDFPEEPLPVVFSRVGHTVMLRVLVVAVVVVDGDGTVSPVDVSADCDEGDDGAGGDCVGATVSVETDAGDAATSIDGGEDGGGVTSAF